MAHRSAGYPEIDASLRQMRATISDTQEQGINFTITK
jgi:hypothetical protein